MNYKPISVVIFVLLVFLIPIILLIFNFNNVVFNGDFYKKEFSKYNVYSNLAQYDVEKINKEVLFYLKNGKNQEIIANDFFNAREKQHLLDVRNLIAKLFFAYHISIFLFLSSFLALCLHFNFKFRKIIEKFLLALLSGNFFVLVAGILLFFLWNSNFYFIFGALHETFFPAGTYSFNPGFEKIVVLYPENLFFDALSEILLQTILSSIIIIFLVFLFFSDVFRAKFSNFFLKIFRRKT